MKKNKLMFLAASLAVMCAFGGCSNSSDTTETTVSAEVSAAVDSETTSAAAVEGTSETTENSGEKTTKANEEAAFPVLIDDEKLSLDSVFQFSGTNPDKDFEEQENICSVQITNVSGEYLEKADITLNCVHGEKYNFTIEDLPDGMTVYAFDTDNNACELEESVELVSVDSDYNADGMGELNSDVTADAESSSVTLKNTGSDSLENLVVKYHDSMDGVIFGGTSYEATVDSLGSGSSTEVSADEVMLGDAVVTSVTEK